MLASQTNRINKNRGYSSEVKPPPLGALEHADDFTSRHLNNFIVVAGTCVTKTTQITYTTGWNAFVLYCKLSSTIPSLKVVPPSLLNKVLPYPLAVIVIGSFMCYLSVDKKLCPITVSCYTSAVRDGFRSQCADFSFFDHIVLKQIRQSLRLAWVLKDEQTSNFTHRLPVTIEMLVVMRKNIANFCDLKDRASYVACIMATTMILRSAHLVMTTANHFIRAKDIKFIFVNPANMITFECIATDACKHSSAHLVGVSVYIRSAKKDIFGEGYIISYKVRTLGPDCVFCVATIMFEWAKIAQPSPLNPFLSYNGRVGPQWALTYERYKSIIKRTATFCGFDSKRFGTHSCRIGGATILAADGHPNHSIQKAGGWSSLSFLSYVQWTQKSWDSILTSLVNPKVYTNAQMKNLNPSAMSVAVGA